MADKTVSVRLQAATAQYQAAMAKASAVTREFQRNITGAGDATDQSLKRVGRGALVASGLLAAGLGLSAKAAVDWESAWAGVTKTVNGSEAQLSSLQEGLRGMARELPATHGEIAGVAEAAGQLGIKVGDVESFTRVMIDLGETTNLTADQAATSLARISNIMGTSARDIDRMGSTIVELGNNSATTEAEIVELGTRLAAAGKIAGLSEADVFAFASTLTSVGVEAEAGGTALSKVFTSVRDAVLDGSENLETFAEVAGISTSEFSRAFEDDAAGAIEMFIAGLGRMNAQGQSTTAVFEDLKLTDQRLMRALLSTAAAGDLLTDQLAMADSAWEENIALQTEAEKRYATTSAQMEIARNKFADLGITAGSVLLPALNSVVGGVGNLADGVAALPGPLQTGAVALGALSSAGLGTIGIVATLAPKVKEAKAALEGMGTMGQFAGRNMGKLAGGAAALGVAVGAGILIYEAATRASREYDEAVKEMVGSLGAVREGQLSVNDALEEYLDLQQMDMSSGQLDVMNQLGISMDDVRDAILEGRDALDPFREALQAAGIEGDKMLKHFDVGELDDITSGEAMAALSDFAGSLGFSASELRSLIDMIEDYDNVQQDAAETTLKAMLSSDELTQAQIDQAAETLGLSEAGENWVAVLDLLAPKNQAVEESTAGLTEELDVQEQAAKDLEEAIDALESAIDGMIGVNLSAEESIIAVEAGIDALSEALKENGNTLDVTTEKGRENRSAITDQVGSIFDMIGALREQGASTDRVTMLTNGYVGQLRETMRQAGLTEGEIDEYLGTLGLTPDAIATTVELYGVAAAEQALNSLTRIRTAQIQAQLNNPYARVAGPQLSGGGLVQHLADGGSVAYLDAGGVSPFVPKGTDTVPAMLTPGEFVQRKSAVDKYGLGFMQAVNAGRFEMASASMIRSTSGGGASLQPVPVRISFDTSGVSDDIARGLKKMVRVEAGGDAQVFFGQDR